MIDYKEQGISEISGCQKLLIHFWYAIEDFFLIFFIIRKSDEVLKANDALINIGHGIDLQNHDLNETGKGPFIQYTRQVF